MFKDRIKQLRKEYGLTQNELSKILSMTQRSYAYGNHFLFYRKIK